MQNGSSSHSHSTSEKAKPVASLKLAVALYRSRRLAAGQARADLGLGRGQRIHYGEVSRPDSRSHGDRIRPLASVARSDARQRGGGRPGHQRVRSNLVLRDVVVGEVWLCSGQSNMGWSVDRSDNAAAEIAAAQFPLLRHFSVALTVAAEPADTVEGAWQKCSPDTVGAFSAVAYFFARELVQELGIPRRRHPQHMGRDFY